MTRSPKGLGSVTKLPSGKYMAKIPIGKDSKGMTRYRTKTANTKAQAEDLRRKMIKAKEDRQLIAGPQVTFRKYAEQVLLSPTDQVGLKTVSGYFCNVKNYAFPVIGGRPIRDITTEEIQQLLDNVRRTKSASTVNNLRAALSHIFTRAHKANMVAFNPVRLTSKAKRASYEKPRKAKPWNLEELTRYMEVARDSKVYSLTMIMISTGMRVGEALALTWDDVDFDTMEIDINKTASYESVIQSDGTTARRHLVRDPKTASGYRKLEITEPMLDILRLHQQEQAISRMAAIDKWMDGNWVFTSNVGSAVDVANPLKIFYKILEQHGIRRIGFHDLRHTFTTILLEEDPTRIAMLSKALGHSSMAITLDVYGNTAKIESGATKAMSKLIFPNHQPAVTEEPIHKAIPIVLAQTPWRRRQ